MNAVMCNELIRQNILRGVAHVILLTENIF